GPAEPAEDGPAGVDALAEDGRADEGVAGEVDAGDADLVALGDVEDDLGVAGLAALEQGAGGEGSALLAVAGDDPLAGDLVGQRVERCAPAEVGHLVQLVLVEGLGPAVLNALDDVGVVADPEEHLHPVGALLLAVDVDVAELPGAVEGADVL